jgi:Zinc dependent phospholipase C
MRFSSSLREKIMTRKSSGRSWLTSAFPIMLALVAFFSWPRRTAAYSVLSHEAIIDAAWDTDIRPLLLKRFPGATPEQIKEAHGYAYGGAIIQDMGYYPHGSFFFSDLTHYVRSGDFILALITDSRDLDGYAFALGALAHYAADNEGHRIGVNRAVPVLYPKLKRKYGDSVTYEEDKLAHVKTEFGFDVLQVARGRYASDGYHDFIGFGVAAPLLEQAFQETYGLDLKDVLMNEDKVLGSYRYDVSKLIPKATRVAWSMKRDDIMKDQPGATKRAFLFNLSRASYRKNWGKNYQRPTFADDVLAFILRILPKIGPLRVLQLKTPTPEAQRMFEASFNATLDRYRKLLHDAGSSQLILPNDNFDTGDTTGPGKYLLNDDTQAQLLDALAKQDFAGASPAIRRELLEFFGHADVPLAMGRDAKRWARLQAEVAELKNAGGSGN